MQWLDLICHFFNLPFSAHLGQAPGLCIDLAVALVCGLMSCYRHDCETWGCIATVDGCGKAYEAVGRALIPAGLSDIGQIVGLLLLHASAILIAQLVCMRARPLGGIPYPSSFDTRFLAVCYTVTGCVI